MRTTGNARTRAAARAIGILTSAALVFGAMPAAFGATTFAVTGTASPASITYGDAVPTYGFSTGGAVLETGDSWSLEPACSTTYVQGDPATTYAFSCTPGTITDGTNDVTANYTIDYSSPGSLTVNQKAIDVTADDDSIMYGEAEPTFTSTEDALVGGDTWSVDPSCDSDYSAGDPAGDYDIVCTGGSIVNVGSVSRTTSYAITYVDGTLTVAALTLTVTADNDTVTYGDAEPTFTFTDDDAFLAGDSWDTVPTCDSEYDAGDPAGHYAITCSGGTITNGTDDVTDSYDITYEDGTLTVDPYSLPEAKVEYTGQTEYRTARSSDTAVQVTLMASVALDTDADETVVCPSDPDLSIADAQVTFIDLDSGRVLAKDVPVSPIVGTDCEGTATALTTLSTGSGGVEDYTILVVLHGSFTGADNGDQVSGNTVAILQAIPTGILGALGGGTVPYQVSAGSSDLGTTGTYAATGQDSSFLLRFVTSTKKTKPSGSATLTIPQGDGSYYEVRTNAITSVTVSGSEGDRTMVIFAKASVTLFDGLGGSTAVSPSGGVSVKITLHDATGGDEAAFTVTNAKTGALLFSTHWVKSLRAWFTQPVGLTGSTLSIS